jgi:serine/threonine-protein kinase RsbT
MVTEKIDVTCERDIVLARQAARSRAASLGFGPIDQSRIATAVSELARNVVRYATAGIGRVEILELTNGARTGIEIVVEDDGPGIPDADLALTPGYTSGRGLGLGLSGTRRLMDEMSLESKEGVGTKVTVRKWKR